MKAFLGMGLLGSNFVRALRLKNEPVQVWNRNTSKAKEMEQYGAHYFAEVEDAVKGATIIHLTLKDDASVNEVLEKAMPGLMKGAIIVDHTTTSVQGAADRTEHWKKRGFSYQHAPVFMGPPNALESSGYMLVSGNQELIKTLQPDLEKMTGTLLNFGEEPGKAAALKLLGNAFLVGFTTSIADTLTLAKSMNTPITDLQTLFSAWNPGAQLLTRMQRVATGDHTKPSWELNMARKDTQLFLNAAEQSGHQLTVIPAVAKLMDYWIEKGFGNSDWTVIAKEKK